MSAMRLPIAAEMTERAAPTRPPSDLLGRTGDQLAHVVQSTADSGPRMPAESRRRAPASILTAASVVANGQRFTNSTERSALPAGATRHVVDLRAANIAYRAARRRRAAGSSSRRVRAWARDRAGEGFVVRRIRDQLEIRMRSRIPRRRIARRPRVGRPRPGVAVLPRALDSARLSDRGRPSLSRARRAPTTAPSSHRRSPPVALVE
jgi:hypothetical protein